MILNITGQDTLIPSFREILGSTLFFAFLGIPLSFLTVLRWVVNFCLSLRWTFTNIVVILITISALSCIFLAGADRSGRSDHTHDQTWYNKYQRYNHLSPIPSEDEVVRAKRNGRAAAIHARGRYTHRQYP
ncbi:hypothetical protein L486_05668 [Kwoniella mangroviensis CBS 10435]|uniref:Uncharacterized protein n=1 Tax=Kwoniella mangroviensis CBS 10435 TaxID=1331196 RepID=A0A1B9IMM3_9TREE|nr:hypothetical protein L486_05668 [Kwoniella mangroviensis CBS 10435]OCF75383.1 hypothetical protein I204_04238 [Kwoniella mangroviensis CBS 8886]